VVTVNRPAILHGVDELGLKDSLTGVWRQLQLEIARSAERQICLLLVFVKVDNVLFNVLVLLRGESSSAPHEAQVHLLLLVSEVVKHFPESLDDLMLLRTVFVASHVLKPLNIDFLMADDLELQVLCRDHLEIT
jgi:hypothetical protein